MDKISNDEFADKIRSCQQEMYRLSFAVLKNSEDAQDAVSDAIIKAFENKDKLRDVEKFRPWIMRILMNASKSLLRHRRQYVLVEDMASLNQGVTESQDEMWELVMELEEEFCTVVVLYYYQGFSTKEISWMIKVPEGTVKSRLARAREKLKVLIL